MNTYWLCQGYTIRELRRLELRRYHPLGWGACALTSIILAAGDFTGPEQGALYCWIYVKHSVSERGCPVTAVVTLHSKTLCQTLGSEGVGGGGGGLSL
jgi:hypothetical protein